MVDMTIPNKYLWIVISILISIFVANYGNKEDIIYFIQSLPNITGILLTGVLTSLAIIFGLIGVNELMKIHEIEKETNINIYIRLISDIKRDVYIIIASVAISTFISMFSNNNTSMILASSHGNIVCETYKILFLIDIVILIMSLIVVYDVIMALLNISEMRYNLVVDK